MNPMCTRDACTTISTFIFCGVGVSPAHGGVRDLMSLEASDSTAPLPLPSGFQVLALFGGRLWKVIVDLIPRHLALDAAVLPGRRPVLRMVERTNHDRRIVFTVIPEDDRCSALPAKAACREVGGTVVRRFSVGVAKGGSRKIGEHDEEVSGCHLAHSAVAEANHIRRLGRFVPDGPAETSPGDRKSRFLRHVASPSSPRPRVIHPFLWANSVLASRSCGGTRRASRRESQAPEPAPGLSRT